MLAVLAATLRRKETEMANEVVNPQITDAVTQAHVENVASAPAMAMAQLYQASTQALGNGAHNATAAQQSANQLGQAVTMRGVTLLLNGDRLGGLATTLDPEREPGK